MMSIVVGPKWPFYSCIWILDCWDRFMQVMYLGRAPRTKETLPDFPEKCRVTRHSRVFRGLTGSQRTPRIWGVTSPLSVMKPPIPKSFSPSVSEPLTMKPTRGELRSRLEVLAKKKRSVKQKPLSSLEGCPPARGKILKVGASSSPSSTVGAGDSSGRADEPPLKVLPISAWSPTS